MYLGGKYPWIKLVYKEEEEIEDKEENNQSTNERYNIP